MLPDRRLKKIAKVGVEGSNPFARSNPPSRDILRDEHRYPKAEHWRALRGQAWDRRNCQPPVDVSLGAISLRGLGLRPKTLQALRRCKHTENFAAYPDEFGIRPLPDRTVYPMIRSQGRPPDRREAVDLAD